MMLLPVVVCQSASCPLKSPVVTMECLDPAGETWANRPVDQALAEPAFCIFVILFGVGMPFLSPDFGVPHHPALASESYPSTQQHFSRLS